MLKVGASDEQKSRKINGGKGAALSDNPGKKDVTLEMYGQLLNKLLLSNNHRDAYFQGKLKLFQREQELRKGYSQAKHAVNKVKQLRNNHGSDMMSSFKQGILTKLTRQLSTRLKQVPNKIKATRTFD